MCSISINATVENQFEALGSKKKEAKLRKRIFDFAKEGDVDRSGVFDDMSCHMRRMPPELREIRKKTIGRHRLYFTGFHKQCSYHAFYLKVNKRKGVDDDDNKIFQNKLHRALDNSEVSILPAPTQNQTINN